MSNLTKYSDDFEILISFISLSICSLLFLALSFAIDLNNFSINAWTLIRIIAALIDIILIAFCTMYLKIIIARCLKDEEDV